MAQLTVRNIEGDIKARLKRRALRNGTSMAAEVRRILSNALNEDEMPAGRGLGSRMAARFKTVGLVDPLPELRSQAPEPAKLRK